MIEAYYCQNNSNYDAMTMMLSSALRVVGSAHDGRKKSIMQTLAILPLPSPYTVMHTRPTLQYITMLYYEVRRNQGYRGRLRGWAIRIASPSGFMGHGYSSPLILALCHLGSGSKSSFLWNGGRWSLSGRCFSWPFSRSGT